jgi:membrane protease YdiL (CAAX protease family)
MMNILKKQTLVARLKTWGFVLLYLVAWLLALVIFSLPFLLMDDSTVIPDNIGSLLNAALMLAAALLVTFLFCKWIHKETLSGIGLDAFTKKWKDLLWGMLYGIVGIAAGFLICYAAGVIQVTAMHFPSGLPLILVAMILVAVAEELLFRGYVLRRFMKVYNQYIALAVSSVLFMLLHGFNAHLDILPFVNLFLAGVLLGSYYIYTQNLWFPIGLHFTWNFFQGSVFGFPVSGADVESIIVQQPVADMDWLTGGAFGFEGSALCTAVCVLLTLAVYFQYRHKVAIKS